MAVASLVLGIAAIAFSPFGLAWIGLPAGIVGLILGIMAKKKAPSGMATAGFVLSIIGLALSAITLIACAACVGGVNSLVNSLN